MLARSSSGGSRTGQLICSERRNNRRVYDLPERRLSTEQLGTQWPREQILAGIADRPGRHGIATVQDLATYYHLKPTDALEALQLAGAQQVTVEGWTTPGWFLESDIPAAGELVIPRPSLIGPFDNLIFDRDRTRRTHRFDYAFEAYKPAAKRIYGHYVMAILNTNGALLGRADLRREAGGISVLASYPERGVVFAELQLSLETATSALQRQLIDSKDQ